MDALGANPAWPSMSKKVATITIEQDKLRKVIKRMFLPSKKEQSLFTFCLLKLGMKHNIKLE